ncbi:hypothetical protein LMG27177_05403 [Paraburkholderia fynbosensis]|uniref:Uncharacterized protein n=2 Tax=Paraburkholderia fynbosensis TaxID=1200993 RepID=A0A6J5GRA2_9BURK|nr:hypothetical protein LMG27177_05403 [Paraburkholderia fynbosensis]
MTAEDSLRLLAVATGMPAPQAQASFTRDVKLDADVSSGPQSQSAGIPVAHVTECDHGHVVIAKPFLSQRLRQNLSLQ